MNWGIKIVLGLGAFMLFIVCSVIYMVTTDSDTLIEDDYYEQSLNYDEVYDRKQNLQDDHAKPLVKIVHDTLIITFTTEKVKGELNFKRPSDGSLDKVIPLYTNTNIVKLPISTLAKGNWLLEVKWDSHGVAYIHNQSIFIQ